MAARHVVFIAVLEFIRRILVVGLFGVLTLEVTDYGGSVNVPSTTSFTFCM